MTDSVGSAPTSPSRGIVTVAVAALLMLAVYALPSPPSLARNGEVIALTAEGKACLGILLFAVTLWVTEAFHLR